MVDGIDRLSKQNDYDDGDIDSLKGHENVSTSAALNAIGNHAGLGDTHALRGRDKTSADIVTEHQAAVRGQWGFDPKEAAAHGAGAAAEHMAEHGLQSVMPRLAFRALGGLALPIHLVELGAKMAESVAADSNAGHDRAEAQVKSAMHVMILGNLNGLPRSYVDSERARYAADAPAGLVQRMTSALARGDNGLMAVAQLHCDQGMNAARAMVQVKQSQPDYFAAHPDVAKRVADDAAFRAGFEGTLRARETGEYDAAMKALDARDARYEAHHVAWRG